MFKKDLIKALNDTLKDVKNTDDTTEFICVIIQDRKDDKNINIDIHALS